MSQYSISIKSIIDTHSIANHNFNTLGNTAERINLGRKIFFNFDYDASDIFKELFETAFILNNLRENICYDDVEYWLLKLKNDVKAKIPVYSKMYNELLSLSSSDITADNITEHKSQRTSRGNSTSTGNSKSKGLGSQYPVDIAKADNFEDVKYMDNGTINESKSNGASESIVNDEFTERNVNKSNTIEMLDKISKLELDIINNAVSSLNNLFMMLW